MLAIQGSPQQLCDGLKRRTFLQVGAIGGFGLSIPRLLRAGGTQSSGTATFGRAKRCVLLFLTGGPPQHDTWDMKPDAPAGIRGELKPIATRVPGIHVSELFPRLAAQAQHYSIVRSVTHNDRVHTSAGYTMLTGVYHPTPNLSTAALIAPKPNDHPHFGSIVAKMRGWRSGLPPFVSIPEVIKDAGTNEFPGQRAGFLGDRYSPFLVAANDQSKRLRLPDIYLPPGMTARRLADRRVLLEQINRRFQAAEAKGGLADLDDFNQQAFSMINSPKAQRAFELDRESAEVRQSYGEHLFGQGCLLARRLLEAGVNLVTVYWHYEGPYDSPVWDTHWNNFPHLRKRLMPPADLAVSSLLSDLSSRGMLDDTLLVCMGEFGRSPKINGKGGRDHWPGVQSIMLAGAGIRGGSVYGATDNDGGAPADKPVSPPDLTATLLHLLGVPPQLELHDLFHKPVAASSGTPISGLIG